MSQPPLPPGPPTQPLPQPQSQTWPLQGMPPGGQQPPDGPVPVHEPEGVRVAETEQRFVLHARSRNVARIIGYPAGLFLLALGPAVIFGVGDLGDLGWGIFITATALFTLLGPGPWTGGAGSR
jgi:hypothetical protein